jgi:hypothetical protein
VRRYGLFAPNRRAELDIARRILQNASDEPPADSPTAAPKWQSPCPHCRRGVLRFSRRVRPGRAPPAIRRPAA